MSKITEKLKVKNPSQLVDIFKKMSKVDQVTGWGITPNKNSFICAISPERSKIKYNNTTFSKIFQDSDLGSKYKSIKLNSYDTLKSAKVIQQLSNNGKDEIELELQGYLKDDSLRCTDIAYIRGDIKHQFITAPANIGPDFDMAQEALNEAINYFTYSPDREQLKAIINNSKLDVQDFIAFICTESGLIIKGRTLVINLSEDAIVHTETLPKSVLIPKSFFNALDNEQYTITGTNIGLKFVNEAKDTTLWLGNKIIIDPDDPGFQEYGFSDYDDDQEAIEDENIFED